MLASHSECSGFNSQSYQKEIEKETIDLGYIHFYGAGHMAHLAKCLPPKKEDLITPIKCS